MTHKYEGQWGIVVWPADAKRWRDREVKHPGHEMVTLRFVHEAGAAVRATGGILECNLRPGYAITFHLDTLSLFVPASGIKGWLERREGKRYPSVAESAVRDAYLQAHAEPAP